VIDRPKLMMANGIALFQASWLLQVLGDSPLLQARCGLPISSIRRAAGTSEHGARIGTPIRPPVLHHAAALSLNEVHLGSAVTFHPSHCAQGSLPASLLLEHLYNVMQKGLQAERAGQTGSNTDATAETGERGMQRTMLVADHRQRDGGNREHR
jgi:hypothetical protein